MDFYKFSQSILFIFLIEVYSDYMTTVHTELLT